MTAEENAIRDLERKALAELIGTKMAIKKELEIKYVAMPISIEQKKEYHAQGFRVIDAKFAPEGYNAEPEVKEVPTRQRRRRNVEEETEE
ncbi:MAG: hypothetical protein RSC43_00555 [Clostridia bacterium]